MVGSTKLLLQSSATIHALSADLHYTNMLILVDLLQQEDPFNMILWFRGTLCQVGLSVVQVDWLYSGVGRCMLLCRSRFSDSW